MDGLGIFKKVVGFTVGAGISRIVSGIVRNNVETEKTLDKVTVWIGEYALTMVLQEVVQQHVDAKIDGYVEKWNNAVAKAKEEDTIEGEDGPDTEPETEEGPDTEPETDVIESISSARSAKAIAKTEEKQYNITQARLLRDTGLSYTDIGKQMRLPESTIRNFLKD